MAEDWQAWFSNQLQKFQFKSRGAVMLLPGTYLFNLKGVDYLIIHCRQADGTEAWIAVEAILDEKISPAFKQKGELLEWLRN